MNVKQIDNLANVLAAVGSTDKNAWRELVAQAKKQQGKYFEKAMKAIYDAIEGTEVETAISQIIFQEISCLVEALKHIESVDSDTVDNRDLDRAWKTIIGEVQCIPGRAGDLCMRYLVNSVQGTAAETVVVKIASNMRRKDMQDAYEGDAPIIAV